MLNLFRTGALNGWGQFLFSMRDAYTVMSWFLNHLALELDI